MYQNVVIYLQAGSQLIIKQGKVISAPMDQSYVVAFVLAG